MLVHKTYYRQNTGLHFLQHLPSERKLETLTHLGRAEASNDLTSATFLAGFAPTWKLVAHRLISSSFQPLEFFPNL